MIIEFIIGATSASISAVASYLITKKTEQSKYDIYEANAKAKAKVIEHEATLLLKDAKYQIKEKEVELKEKFDDEILKLKDEYNRKKAKLDKEKESIAQKINEIQNEKIEMILRLRWLKQVSLPMMKYQRLKKKNELMISMMISKK